MKKKKTKKVKKKVRLNRNGKILVAVIFAIGISLICCSVFGFLLQPAEKKNENIKITISAGDTYLSIGSLLKEKRLIRSEFGYRIYIKFTHPTKSLKAGEHTLNKNMSLKKIIETLQESPMDHDVITMTFREGMNMRGVASVIANNTGYSTTEVFEQVNHATYLDSLIKKYWFLTDEIKNSDIYYALEGYLYPNTYEFKKDVSLTDIIETMLDETDRQLSRIRKKLESAPLSIHQIITLSSLVELEAVSDTDRENVARVFYNRLDNGMSLGSDVTTYYAAKVDMGERDLYQSELSSTSLYNTRSPELAGKLPIGPICNPSIAAISVSIQPKENDYFYFVADKNKKVYFTKTASEHNAMIAKLQSEGLWYSYE